MFSPIKKIVMKWVKVDMVIFLFVDLWKTLNSYLLKLINQLSKKRYMYLVSILFVKSMEEFIFKNIHNLC